jgi:hypothetical protein
VVPAADLLPADPVARLTTAVPVVLPLAVPRPARMPARVDLLPVLVAQVVLVLAVADHPPNR